MSFIFSNLHMNNLSNDIVSTIKQLNEKLNFYHDILVRNAQMYVRLENLVY